MALFWGVKGVFDIKEKINKKSYKISKNIVFMGTPEFAVPSLEALIESKYNVIAVYTQPDRKSGRGQKMLGSPVKEKAINYGIKIVQPETLKDKMVYEQLGELDPNVIIVAAYGKIIPPQILNIPILGCINIHPSLLPKYRGASPIASAILNGESITGTSIMLLDEGLDSGPVISQREVKIEDNDTTGSLTDKIANISAKFLLEILPLWMEGKIQAKPQIEDLSTYTKTITKQDGEIDWHVPAVELWRRVRAFNPWPRCYTWWQGKQLVFTEVVPVSTEMSDEIGKVIVLGKSELATVGVKTGKGILGLIKVKLEGKREMNVEEFIRGQRNFIGSKLG